jgi:hypothetical protein
VREREALAESYGCTHVRTFPRNVEAVTNNFDLGTVTAVVSAFWDSMPLTLAPCLRVKLSFCSRSLYLRSEFESRSKINLNSGCTGSNGNLSHMSACRAEVLACFKPTCPTCPRSCHDMSIACRGLPISLDASTVSLLCFLFACNCVGVSSGYRCHRYVDAMGLTGQVAARNQQHLY